MLVAGHYWHRHVAERERARDVLILSGTRRKPQGSAPKESSMFRTLAIVAGLTVSASGVAMAQHYVDTCPYGYAYSYGACRPMATPGGIVGGAVGTAGAVAGGAVNAAGDIAGGAVNAAGAIAGGTINAVTGH
jgi:hypothetical protein